MGFMVLCSALILVMGMILDSTSILLIMVPIAAPIAQHMGIDLSQFGIVIVIAVEIGLLTPPFGISVFTVHNTLNDPDVSVEQIFAARCHSSRSCCWFCCSLFFCPALPPCSCDGKNKARIFRLSRQRLLSRPRPNDLVGDSLFDKTHL